MKNIILILFLFLSLLGIPQVYNSSGVFIPPGTKLITDLFLDNGVILPDSTIGIGDYIFMDPEFGSVYQDHSNETINLWFKINTPGRVKILIYDSRGILISIPIDSNYPTGSQSIFYSNKLKNGVYFFVFCLPSKKITQKIIKI